jgi:hypothetical protein
MFLKTGDPKLDEIPTHTENISSDSIPHYSDRFISEGRFKDQIHLAV